MSFDFLSAIKNVAPMLATTFGTPLLGMAVSAVCGALPADQAATVQAAHASDPQSGALGKLGEMFQQGIINTEQIKQAEIAHAQRMAELGYKSVVDLAKIAADDRASARQREVMLKDETPKILAAVIVIAWCIIQWHLINNSVPNDMREIIIRVLGTLDAALMLVLNYFFGSSAQSKNKDDTINQLSK